MLKDLLKKTRSYRRYDAAYPVPEEVLRDMVDHARIVSCGANMQPLKYKLVFEPDRVAQVFAITKWGMALKDYSGPEPGERPTAYIGLAVDKNILSNTGAADKDVGIAAQVLAMSAAEKGLGTCMIGNFSRPKFKELAQLPEEMEPVLLLAVGKPVEEIVLEELRPGQPSAYYRTDDKVHHVPKRRLEDILL